MRIGVTIAVAAAASIIFAATAPAGAFTDRSQATRPAFQLPLVTVTSIVATRAATWDCQRRAGLTPSRAELGVRALAAAGLPFRSWTIARWETRLAACRGLLARTIPVTNDWTTATSIADRFWPGAARWLLDCSSSEGGHGAWVWRGGTPARFDAAGVPTNYPGNVPGGPMQYFESTFWGDFNPAVLDLRARGVRIPTAASSWFSMLGQALAGGWAYDHSRGAGKWTGLRC
jgi:hypothetical protein